MASVEHGYPFRPRPPGRPSSVAPAATAHNRHNYRISDADREGSVQQEEKVTKCGRIRYVVR